MFWIVFISTMLIGLWAQAKVKSAFAKYSGVRAHNGYSGGQVAASILRSAGIHDVEIRTQPGTLNDHYDPIHKRLVLSDENYHGNSISAIAVAAHECGHALQHQQAYAPLKFRMASVGITSVANGILTWLMIIGLFLGLIPMAFAFKLITLPVEFDASRRAKLVLSQMGFTATTTEDEGVSKVLNAAALTYVAAFITSLAWFLYYILPFITGGSDD
jgi:Zn-dependent membrane protease YugP